MCLPVQVDLLELIKDMVFQPTVELLYGAAFVAGQEDMARLQQAFFDFEAGFELAASPVPHVLQCNFCAARRYLLSCFRQVATPCHAMQTHSKKQHPTILRWDGRRARHPSPATPWHAMVETQQIDITQQF